MADRTLYVVQGSSGEYSDFRTWPVRAFLDETEAATFVLKATARAAEIRQAFIGSVDYSWAERVALRESMVNEFDPPADMDYDAVTYEIVHVPLDASVQQAIAAAVVRDQNYTRSLVISGHVGDDEQDQQQYRDDE